MLSQLVLRHFRSFQEEAVNFANPTLIVGRNGTGKSNFVDALALLAEAMNSSLQTALERRGGFAAIGHRSSARGRPSNLGLAVALRNPDSQTSKAHYGFKLRSSKEYGFEVVREQCALWKTDDSCVWFDRRTKNTASQWESSTGFLEPALEANALALPLVDGDSRFQAVFRFLLDMQLYRIDPDAVRSLQEPDEGIRLRFNGSTPPAFYATFNADRLTNGRASRNCLRKWRLALPMSAPRGTATSWRLSLPNNWQRANP